MHSVEMFAVFLSFLGYVTSDKPKCPANYMEERLLERMLEINVKIQDTLDRLDRIEKERDANRQSFELQAPFPQSAHLISDLESDGWQLIFRATSGNGFKVFDAWTHGRGSCENKPTSMERSYSCHYRSRNIANWSNLGIRYLKFALYNNDNEVSYIIFNGVDSNMNNWFSSDRVIASSYSDLTTTEQYNYFSISGHVHENAVERRFFINKKYEGCPGDRGHIAVIDEGMSRPACSMDRQPSYPQFIYSLANTAIFWEKENYGMADYLAVFVKTS